VAATNCLNFGNPEKPEIMAQLSAAIDGISEACKALGTPITGGNVSLYNETKGEGIDPTPVIGVVGILDDVSKAVPAAFQEVGDEILLIGPSFGAPTEKHRLSTFGSSSYAKVILQKLWGIVPTLDLGDEMYLQKALVRLAREGLLRSACDISDGGLAVGLAEAGFTKDLGSAVKITRGRDGAPVDGIDALFSEKCSVVVVSCHPENRAAIEKIIEDEGELYCESIGKVTKGSFEIALEDDHLVSTTIRELKVVWSSALQSALSVDTVTA
jgi:phosphoribosylformylglycinamidine synthase